MRVTLANRAVVIAHLALHGWYPVRVGGSNGIYNDEGGLGWAVQEGVSYYGTGKKHATHTMRFNTLPRESIEWAALTNLQLHRLLERFRPI